MRDWERAQAHYRSAERYAAAGNDDKAASHAPRAWVIDRQSRFGGLKKDLGRLFGKKNSDEKQGKHRDDKPVPDVPNVQATRIAKPVPEVPNVQATHTAATPIPLVPATVQARNLPLFSVDVQDDFLHVLQTKVSAEKDPKYTNVLAVEGMDIYMRKEDINISSIRFDHSPTLSM